jgi:bacterioferritin
MMQGNKKVIDNLNKALAAELAHISQYIVHSEICSNWGYKSLSSYIKKRAIEEMKHAERLIERIIFLEGIPIVSDLDPINIGSKVPEMFDNDHLAEETVIELYNQAIVVCVNAADNDTRQMLEQILLDETRHIDDIESNQAQIEQMSIGIYLSQQI